MVRNEKRVRGRTIDLDAAYRDARKLLEPRGIPEDPTPGASVDSWRLARAQWYWDYGSRKLAESEVREINALRRARRDRYPDLELVDIRR
jgi:hypothetical protein